MPLSNFCVWNFIHIFSFFHSPRSTIFLVNIVFHEKREYGDRLGAMIAADEFHTWDFIAPLLYNILFFFFFKKNFRGKKNEAQMLKTFLASPFGEMTGGWQHVRSKIFDSTVWRCLF